MHTEPHLEIKIPNHETFCVIDPDIPTTIGVRASSVSEPVIFKPSKVASIITTTIPNTDNSVGNSCCELCSTSVEPQDFYCRHCGAFLIHNR